MTEIKISNRSFPDTFLSFIFLWSFNIGFQIGRKPAKFIVKSSRVTTSRLRFHNACFQFTLNYNLYKTHTKSTFIFSIPLWKTKGRIVNVLSSFRRLSFIYCNPNPCCKIRWLMASCSRQVSKTATICSRYTFGVTRFRIFNKNEHVKCILKYNYYEALKL